MGDTAGVHLVCFWLPLALVVWSPKAKDSLSLNMNVDATAGRGIPEGKSVVAYCHFWPLENVAWPVCRLQASCMPGNMSRWYRVMESK